jgi:flagellar motor switch protein FliN/FliY
MTTEDTAGSNDRLFSKVFFNALASALTDASGSPWQIVDVPDSDLTPDEADPARIKLTLEGSLRGECLLEFRRTEAAMLVSKFLQTPVVEFGAEQSESLVKLITAGAGLVRSELGQRYGVFDAKASSESEAAVNRTNCVRVTVADDGGNRVPIWMYIDSMLSEQLAVDSKARSAAADVETLIKAVGRKGIAEQINLDLVMDVELNVTLRFGKRKLTLREVLELTSGSVVELDRQVEEPVELLLDGVVIARGEAVVVDGNYGLRVTEVSQPLSSAVLR